MFPALSLGPPERVEKNDDWKAYRGGLVLKIKVADTARLARDGWVVLSFQFFPAQRWVAMKASSRDKAATATRLGYPPGRLKLEKFQARSREYLVVDYWLPCPDGSAECGDYNEVETTLFDGSSETGWSRLDSFRDGGSKPFVDVDGDGLPEFVGPTGYKGYVLRRIVPKRETLFISNSGV